MTPLQLRRAAYMWANGLGTFAIAKALRTTDPAITEASVYNRIDWIKAMAYRVKHGETHPTLIVAIPRPYDT